MWSHLLSSNTQWVLFSTMILGIGSGVIGCLAYWKRQNLMSDALSHAALPGVVVVFLLTGEKHLFYLVIGTGVGALSGAYFSQAGERSSCRSAAWAMGCV